jgi:hypothetical protein
MTAAKSMGLSRQLNWAYLFSLLLLLLLLLWILACGWPALVALLCHGWHLGGWFLRELLRALHGRKFGKVLLRGVGAQQPGLQPCPAGALQGCAGKQAVAGHLDNLYSSPSTSHTRNSKCFGTEVKANAINAALAMCYLPGRS